jgi:hypothetical protein
LKYYAVKTPSDLFVEDNFSKNNESFKGALVYKKKRNALECCDEMNELAKSLKRKPDYKVSEFTQEDITDSGIILDGVWKKKL